MAGMDIATIALLVIFQFGLHFESTAFIRTTRLKLSILRIMTRTSL
jgi:hypothetical protein